MSCLGNNMSLLRVPELIGVSMICTFLPALPVCSTDSWGGHYFNNLSAGTLGLIRRVLLTVRKLISFQTQSLQGLGYVEMCQKVVVRSWKMRFHKGLQKTA